MSPALSDARPGSWRSLAVFAVGSALAVGAGAWTLWAAGEPTGLWVRNGIAWAIGLAAAMGIGRATPGLWARRFLVGIACVALASTFLSEGQQGVHRWLVIGPVAFNAAALVLPSLLVFLSREPSPRGRMGVVVVVAALLGAQPDASQAVAFALACVAWGAGRPEIGWARRLQVAGPALIGAAVAWARPDPLEPVLNVEGIVALAAGHSMVAAVLMVAGVGLSALSPLVGGRTFPPLAVYLLAIAVAPVWGAFPVPLAGYGLSFVLGQFLGMAALLRCEAAAPRI